MTKANLPAIRYESFLDAFQRAVAEAQQRVKALEAGQPEYNACAEAIRRCPIPNDGELKLLPSGAHIQLYALPYDRKATFDTLAMAIGAELVERKMHGDGVPAENFSTAYLPEIVYAFRTKRRDGTVGGVQIEVVLPHEGIVDLEVTREVRTSQTTHYVIAPRTAPRVAPPAGVTVHQAEYLPF